MSSVSRRCRSPPQWTHRAPVVASFLSFVVVVSRSPPALSFLGFPSAARIFRAEPEEPSSVPSFRGRSGRRRVVPFPFGVGWAPMCSPARRGRRRLGSFVTRVPLGRAAAARPFAFSRERSKERRLTRAGGGLRAVNLCGNNAV